MKNTSCSTKYRTEIKKKKTLTEKPKTLPVTKKDPEDELRRVTVLGEPGVGNDVRQRRISRPSLRRKSGFRLKGSIRAVTAEEQSVNIIEAI